MNEPSDEAKQVKNNGLEMAHKYAWDWFSLHAQQRNAVFRFFLVLVGFITAGILSTFQYKLGWGTTILSGILIAISVLFWRLDLRSYRLIKIGEAGLKKTEEAISALADINEIRMAEIADNKKFNKDPKSPEFHVYRNIYTYRQIYETIFVIVFAIGLVVFLYSIMHNTNIIP